MQTGLKDKIASGKPSIGASVARVANLETILEISGIDARHIGPGDLAMSMGYQDRDHPAVQQMIAEGRRKILASGKALFGGAADVSTARQMIEQGSLLIHTRVTEMWGNITKIYLQELCGDTTAQ